jgi:hypothetical protein
MAAAILVAKSGIRISKNSSDCSVSQVGTPPLPARAVVRAGCSTMAKSSQEMSGGPACVQFKKDAIHWRNSQTQRRQYQAAI